MNPWEGKHIWIWELDQTGDPQLIVEKAIALGLAGLIVKAWDGSSYWSQIESITGLAKAAGLIVGAWGYSYGTNPQGEAQAAERAVATGADWLIIDAEAEYENSLGSTRADNLGNAFQAISSVPIGYTSFAIAQYHPDFPYAQFSKWCHVVLPQVYWGDFGMSVDQALSMSVSGLQDYSLPIAPIGQCYNAVAADDIISFGQLAQNAGLPGISYWDWQEATSAMLDAIGNAPYNKEANAVSDWAAESWNKAVAKGVFDGTNPQGTVTREMLAVLFDRLGLLDDNSIPQSVVTQLITAGLITNDHPTGARLTWGEFSTVMERLLQKNAKGN